MKFVGNPRDVEKEEIDAFILEVIERVEIYPAVPNPPIVEVS